jgi:DNA/RNA-binding domain of Phe-tRNA-synthetase-like protein
MNVTVDSAITELVPTFKIGVIHYDGIQVGKSPQMLRGRLQLFQESIFFDLEEKPVTAFPGIQEWRQLFKTFGKDPNRYRHSAEALYRRIKKQNYLTSVNSAIDVNNFFSLKYETPIGIYDKDHIKGDVILRIGKDGEEYIGLNGRSNSLDGLLVSCDALGPFGSPFVDSDRTPVTETTTSALQIIYLRPSLSKEESEKLTKSLMDMFLQIHGGTGTFEVIGK